MSSWQLADRAVVRQADRQRSQRAEPLDLGTREVELRLRRSGARSPVGVDGSRGLRGHGASSMRVEDECPMTRTVGRMPHDRPRRDKPLATARPTRQAMVRRRAGMLSGASCRRTPRDGRAPRAGRSGRSRAGSGCPGSRTAIPAGAGRRRPRPAPAAQSSIRTPGTVSRGKPIEPARGRTQLNRSAQSSKKASSRSRFAATIPRERASTRSPARKRDDREDLRRRRRADRRVVLERRDARQQIAVVGRQPADAESGQRVRLRHHAERDAARQRVGAGRQAIGRRRTRGRGRPRRGGGVRRRRRRSPPTRRTSRGRAASRSGCAGH